MTAIHPDLDGASVFITGGGSGIGAALVAGFLRQNAQVTFVDLADASNVVAEMTAATGNTPRFVRCDVTDTDALREAITGAHAAQGGLDVMVNNAANDMRMAADTITPDAWDNSQNVNLRSVFFGAQTAAALMQDGGSIINYASITVHMGMAGALPYVTAKGGIIAMTRALAREWGPRRIRVNAIAPGWVLTEKQLAMWATDDALADFRAKQCLPDMMEARDMVGPTMFLASDASAMITSQTLVVDAGVVNS